VKHLRAARDESNWDLGDVCLSQCEKIVNDSSIDRIVTRPQHPITSKPEHEHGEASGGTSSHREDWIRPSRLEASGVQRAEAAAVAEDADTLPPTTFDSTVGEYDLTGNTTWDEILRLTSPGLWQTPDLGDYSRFIL